MIVDRIYQYLNGEGKAIDEAILEEVTSRFETVVVRQLMRDREERPGRLYVTRFSHPCARKGAYAYHGFEAEELVPRAKLNFLIGDAVELAVMATAKLAGCDIGLSNERVEFELDGATVSGYIDGLFSDGKALYVAEFKKISAFAYKRVEREGVTDEWGYVSQVHAYMKALELDRAIFVVLDGQSGALNERVTPEDLPPGAFEPEPVLARDRPGRAQNGKMELELRCRYCQYKHHCWPRAQLALRGNKPSWYIKEQSDV